jgi:hypothetical protein
MLDVPPGKAFKIGNPQPGKAGEQKGLPYLSPQIPVQRGVGKPLYFLRAQKNFVGLGDRYGPDRLGRIPGDDVFMGGFGERYPDGCGVAVGGGPGQPGVF